MPLTPDAAPSRSGVADDRPPARFEGCGDVGLMRIAFPSAAAMRCSVVICTFGAGSSSIRERADLLIPDREASSSGLDPRCGADRAEQRNDAAQFDLERFVRREHTPVVFGRELATASRPRVEPDSTCCVLQNRPSAAATGLLLREVQGV